MAFAIGCAALTYGFLIQPYQAADEQGFPLSHGARAWLLDDAGPVATFLPVGAMISVVLVPMVAMGLGVWAATWAWLDWQALRRIDRALLAAGAATAMAVVALHLSPLGRDVAHWWIG